MTFDEVNADLALYLTARDAILIRGVKSYAIGSRNLTALDLPFIEQRMTMLRAMRDRATTGMFLGGRNRRPE